MKQHMSKSKVTIILAGAVFWASMHHAFPGATPSGAPISPPYSIDTTVQLKLWDAGQNIPVIVQCRVQGGKPATIKASIQPWVKVVAESALGDVDVKPTLTASGTGVSTNTTINAGIIVEESGEFIVRFTISDDAGTIRDSQSLFIISRDGRVSISGGDFRICEWQFLMNKYGLSLDTKVTDLPPDKKDAIQNEYKAIRRDRRVKEEEYDRLHGTTQQPAGSNAVPRDTKGTKKNFKAFWTAPNGKKLSIVTAKVEVLNDATDAVLASGNLTLGGKYSDNLEAGGTFEFDDPGVDYKVRITPKYEGGTVGGSAVGTYDPFEVVDNAGNAYDDDFVSAKNATEYTAQGSQDSDTGAARRWGAWNVYHAVLDVAKGAKDQYSLEKGASYNVYFPITDDDAAYYSPSTKDVYIGWNSRNDWDTLGHEYAHLVDDANDIVTDDPHGGSHNGDNQYVNNGNSNKKHAIALAMSEAYATWFGTGLSLLSPYKGIIDGVGDTKYAGAVTYDLEENAKCSWISRISGPPLGEDTEIGVQRMMWDWSDSANNESKTVSGITVSTDSKNEV